MSYYLGVDLGTTYTAAAIWWNHKVEIASLGNRAPVIPSLILLREDEEILTGEAADRPDSEIDLEGLGQAWRSMKDTHEA